MHRLVFQSKACQLFLAANSGKGFLYTACQQKSSFDKPQPLMSDRWESCWPLFGLRPNRLFSDRFNQTPGIEVAPVVGWKNARVCSVDKPSGFSMPTFKIVMVHGAHVFKIHE